MTVREIARRRDKERLRVPVRSGSLAFLLFAVGCSDRPAAQGQDAAVNLCDGSPSLRLIFQKGSGGPAIPGSRVMGENGSQYLLVDGQCSFWAMMDPGKDIRTGTLTASQASDLAQALRLNEWERLAGDYHHGTCDGPTSLYRFGESRILVSSICQAADTAAPVNWVEAAVAERLPAVHATGSPVDGPVRFVLVAEPIDVVWPAFWMQSARRWPLAGDPATIAMTFAEATAYQAGSSDSAVPPDAEALRTLRREFLADRGGANTGGFIPILGPQDERYELFVRDSISLEDAQGLLHIE